MNNRSPVGQWIARRHQPDLVAAIGLFILAALFAFGLKPGQADYFPVRFVRIQGQFNYLEKADLKNELLPLLESGYWALDVERIRFATQRLAWIKAVQIHRIWPDTLVMRVEEHAPFARFGENRLLSTQGVVFAPGDITRFAGLARIDGAIEQSVNLLAATQALKIDLGVLGRTLEKLQVTERGSWSVWVSGGLSIEIGRDQPIETFRRFIATLSLLGEKPIRSMVRVDLRYPNGYAVEWKEGSEPEWSWFEKRGGPRQSEAAQRI